MRQKLSRIQADVRFWWWKTRTLNLKKYLAVVTVLVTLIGTIFFFNQGSLKVVYAAGQVTQVTNANGTNTVTITGDSTNQYVIFANGRLSPYNGVAYNNFQSNNQSIWNSTNGNSDVTINSNTNLIINGNGVGNGPTVYLADNGAGVVNLVGLTVENGGTLSPFSADRLGQNTIYSDGMHWAEQWLGYFQLNPSGFTVPTGGTVHYTFSFPTADDAASLEYANTTQISASTVWNKGTAANSGNADSSWQVAGGYSSNLTLNGSTAPSYVPVRLKYFNNSWSGAYVLQCSASIYNSSGSQLSSGLNCGAGTGHVVAYPTKDDGTVDSTKSGQMDLSVVYAGSYPMGNSVYIHNDLENVTTWTGASTIIRYGYVFGPELVTNENSNCSIFQCSWASSDERTILNNGSVTVNGIVTGYSNPLSSAESYGFVNNSQYLSDYTRTVNTNSLVIDGQDNNTGGLVNGGGRLAIHTTGNVNITGGGVITALGMGYPGGDGLAHSSGKGASGWGPLGLTSTYSFSSADGDGAQYGGGAWSNGSGGGGGGGGRQGSCDNCVSFPGGGGGGVIGRGGTSGVYPVSRVMNFSGGAGSGFHGTMTPAQGQSIFYVWNYLHGAGGSLGGGGGSIGPNVNAKFFNNTYSYPGGAGGGQIHITAGGLINVDGTINASGDTGMLGSSGGGGGTVWMKASGSITVTTNGYLYVNGGLPTYSQSDGGVSVISQQNQFSSPYFLAAGGGGGLIDLDAPTISVAGITNAVCSNPLVSISGQFGSHLIAEPGSAYDGSAPGLISFPTTGNGNPCAASPSSYEVQISKQIQQLNSSVTFNNTQLSTMLSTNADWNNVSTVNPGGYIRVLINVVNPSSDPKSLSIKDIMPVSGMVPESYNGQMVLAEEHSPAVNSVLLPSVDTPFTQPTLTINYTIPANSSYTFIYATSVVSPFSQ